MNKILLVVGMICALLGGLWLLQGLGLVHVRPILCLADCAPLQEASPTYAIVGLLMVLLGALAIFRSLRRRVTASRRHDP